MEEERLLCSSFMPSAQIVLRGRCKAGRRMWHLLGVPQSEHTLILEIPWCLCQT